MGPNRYFHPPLFQQGYSIPSCEHPARSRDGNSGWPYRNRGCLILVHSPISTGGRTPYTRNWWHRKEVDHPPLFTAVQFGNLEIVKLLLQRGADPERYAPSPLYRAVKDNRRDIIPILLKYGVGPQATALKLAVLHRDESMVRLLLDGGLNVSQYGYTGLYTAEMKGDWDMVNLLKSRGATLATLSDIEKGLGEGRRGRYSAYPSAFVYFLRRRDRRGRG